MELLQILLRSTRKCRTNSHRTNKQSRCLELNHIHILRYGNLLLSLKVHVVLLTLAHLRCHRVKAFKYRRQILCIYTLQMAIRLNHHHIARENSHITAPLCIYRRTRTAHHCVIHNIVVQQRKVVEHLHRCSCREYILQVVCIEVIRQHCKHRTHTLTTFCKRVTNWCIEPLRLVRHIYQSDISLKHFGNLFRSIHICTIFQLQIYEIKSKVAHPLSIFHHSQNIFCSCAFFDYL